MPLHLIKLCVGIDTVAELEAWIAEKRRRSGATIADHAHVTRMVPKRADDLLDGGSLFWVIRGQLTCRQSLRAIVPFRDQGGVGRCRLVMAPDVVPVQPRPVRPFQGWRYLEAERAPSDLGRHAEAVARMPEGMRRELAELGLL